jgi:hypothetical protein
MWALMPMFLTLAMSFFIVRYLVWRNRFLLLDGKRNPASVIPKREFWTS